MTGRFLLVHVYFKLDAGSPLNSIEAFDDVRERLHQAFRKHYPFVAMDVVFTQQDKWQKMATGETETPLSPTLGG
jgi:predicted Co/Zn/Cd cation transporter (cation efflux family)